MSHYFTGRRYDGLGILLLAQSADQASIRGQVLDPAQTAVPIAVVELTNPATGFRCQAATDSSGLYTISNLPLTGLHALRVMKQGFAEKAISGIGLRAGEFRASPTRLSIRARSSGRPTSSASLPLSSPSPSITSTSEPRASTGPWISTRPPPSSPRSPDRPARLRQPAPAPHAVLPCMTFKSSPNASSSFPTTSA